ncbi:MAG: CBS domain-containing protein [Oligoflexales bacterium]
MMPSNVGEIMSKNVIAVKESETLADVLQLMMEHDFRHVPVVNDEKSLVGIISERDLLRTCVTEDDIEIAGAERAYFLSDHPVTEIMSTNPETVEQESTLSDACQVMLENKFGCVPVVDSGRLVGILTTTDILKEIIRRDIQGV